MSTYFLQLSGDSNWLFSDNHPTDSYSQEKTGEPETLGEAATRDPTNVRKGFRED